MADIHTPTKTSPKKRRFKRAPVRLDMTPMVDLAFLLLTFFVLTATFQIPKSMELTFPSEGDPRHLKKGITFLLGAGDKIYYYEGELRADEAGVHKNSLLKELRFDASGPNSLRAFLLEKTSSLHSQLKALIKKRERHEISEETFLRLSREAKANKEEYSFLIKPCKEASYKNVIDVVDELNICMVGKYSVCDPLPLEQTLLDEQSPIAQN